jgi:outer membrane protein OmpA-like peptidoglycan-associated protein
MSNCTASEETRSVRKWFLLALVLSLGVHCLLYVYLAGKKLEHFAFSAPGTQRLVQRPFTVKKVTINEELLKPAETPKPKQATPPPKIVPSDEKPQVENLPTDVRFTPNAPAGSEAAKAITTEKPRVETGKIPSPASSDQLNRELDSITDQLASKNAPKIVAGKGGGVPDSTENGHDDPASAGYSNIDTLLSQSGPLKGSVAPVNMPGGALFEYDSATLREEAIETLRKLGALIQRNPRSTFSIEGYTDSFGSPDYNLKLSAERAEAVKAWLVANMKLDPAKIQTKGFGSTHFITPATGTREAQAPNRRVEIVIRTPKE